MGKISIKKFCKNYNALATSQMKDKYLKDNLEITPYVPFLLKDTIISNLLKTTMFDRETGNIRIDSMVEYLFLTRIFVEQYTNLTVETDGFFEEYDELKKSGLFNILFVGNEDVMPLIPYEEIAEFKHLLTIKKQDIMTNHATPQAFISDKIERIVTIGSVTLKPILDKIATELENMDDAKIEKLTKYLDKGLKKIK